MTIGIVENLQSSYDATNRMFHSFGEWVTLIIIEMLYLAGVFLLMFGALGYFLSFAGVPDAALAPMNLVISLLGMFGIAALILGLILTVVFGFLVSGIMIRVYRSGAVTLDRWGSMFLDGLLAGIIAFIYSIPLMILAIVLAFGPMGNPGYAVAYNVILIIASILTSMILLMAIVRFAKAERFGAAFEFREVLDIIATIGWLRYLANMIVLSIVLCVICVILMVILVIGWILLVVVMPFLTIWEAKFIVNLYESATPQVPPVPETVSAAE